MKFRTIHDWFEDYHGEINNSPSLTCQDDGVMEIDDYFRLYGLSRVDTREYQDSYDYAEENDFHDDTDYVFNNVTYLSEAPEFNPKTYTNKTYHKPQNNDSESHPDEVKDNDSEVIPGASD